VEGEGMGIANVLRMAGLVASNGEGFRQIEGGGVRIDGEKVSDKGLQLAKGSTLVVQVGKRKFAKVTLA
ncbi:MAG: tyrosine--tRNA ligase, partial [Burkholderiales bacterium]|nr:tyrosine--tRNA ligase [Burkholderiales bacterium]